MLEIGAGAGRNTPRYQAYERVVLMDYSLTQMQQAQTRLGRERALYIRGCRCLPSAFYGSAISMEPP